MKFFYLIIVSILVSLLLGRIFISDVSNNFKIKVRIVFLFGVLSGFGVFLFIPHISFFEIILQIYTILIGSFIGSMLSTSRTSTLVDDYEESVEQQTVYFRKLFNKGHYELLKEPYSKRVIDLIISIVGILVLLPIYLIISLIIWCDDPGPILFAKHSVGKAGVVFKEYKFRSMCIGSALGEIEDKQKDGRLLRVGAFMRKSHLDELPQLFNILKGEMSLVGPRPLRTIDELDYNKEVRGFMERHVVLPGVAGLAQILSGYHADPQTRLKYDKEYINKRSFILDITILLQSIFGTIRQNHKSGYR